jgi:hypothetical protein
MLKTALMLLLLASPAMACETTVHPHTNVGEKVVGMKMITAPLMGITGIPADWSLSVKTEEEAVISLMADDGTAFVTDLKIVLTTADCVNVAGAIAVVPPNMDPTPDNVVIREFKPEDYSTEE